MPSCQALLAASLSLVLALCACTGTPHQAEFSRGYPEHDCPESLDGQVRLEVEVQSVEVSNPGALGRRLFIVVTPAGLRRGDRIVWSSLTIASYGGTFRGWDQLRQPQTDQGPQISTVALAPGQLRVTRVARGKTDLAGMYSVDVLVAPGGVAVDDTVVRITRLWHDDGTPLPPREVTARLLPVRHPPGLDTVEGDFTLDYVVRLGKGGEEWTCSAQVSKTLVDQEAVRQPFWDLGLASANSARREWLALFDPALGRVRLAFESPAAAQSFAEWMRATRSTQVGHYAVRAFRDSAQSLRPLDDGEIDAIVVGPVGEP
jgi:hypothetical protein